MAEAEFDQIAPMYDLTRGVLDEKTSKGIGEILEKQGCREILEIGVGMGRVALPLLNSGFPVTGVDLSRKMMEKASIKGVSNLVQADAARVPFKDKTFDGTIMAHVFHILPDPISVLHEAARVSSKSVFALVRKGGWGMWGNYFRSSRSVQGEENTSNQLDFGNENIDERIREYIEESRKRFRAISEKYGWNPERQRELHPRNWQQEQDILKKFPPDDLQTVSDIEMKMTLEDRVARFEKNAYSYMLGMPEGMRREIIQEIRTSAERFPDRASQPRHLVYQLAMWRPEHLAD